MENKREHFGSRVAVIASMAGSAIGLGNIWRFPYMVGEHGGSAFIVIYLISTILISMPVFIAEVTIGRRARTSAYGAMSTLRPGYRIWKWAGMLSIAIPLIINSYYSVIGGWSLEYLFKALTGEFVRSSPEVVGEVFSQFISLPWLPVITHLLFLSICAIIVARGVKSGIELFSKISIPILFVLIVAMIVYSITLPGAMEGVRYLIKPDFSQVNPRSLAYAMGQSFYSLSLGMGAIVTYGSYVSKKEDIVVSSAGTAFSDMMFAVFAGFAVMPAVFAAGIEPGAGPGLIFQSIPYIFSSLGVISPALSTVISIVFFLTIVVAAMTSCISLFEVGVSFLNDRFSISRKRACLILFLLCGSIGVLCSLSFGVLGHLTVADKNLFDLLDWFSSNILLLIMAFLVVVFVGFVMKKEDVFDEITNEGTKPVNVRLFNTVYFLIKWVAPISVVIILISNFIL